jgi:pimeloyl-ACP methyl ester carboxylesterase
MGGKTAMLYACDYPEMVDKLVVADIGPKLYPQHHQLILESLQRLSVDQEALSSRKNADAFLLHYIKDTGVRMFLLKNLFWEEPGKLGLRVNLEVLIENIEEIGKPLDISKSFDGSTLFLKGERSNYIQPQDENDIYNAFAKAQIKEIPKAGHWLHAENPTEFFREVMNFV